MPIDRTDEMTAEELDNLTRQIHQRRMALDRQKREEQWAARMEGLTLDDPAEAFNAWWQAHPYSTDTKRRKAAREVAAGLYPAGISWWEFEPEALRHAIEFLRDYTMPPDVRAEGRYYLR
jgi:hypothetical protein